MASLKFVDVVDVVVWLCLWDFKFFLFLQAKQQKIYVVLIEVQFIYYRAFAS